VFLDRYNRILKRVIKAFEEIIHNQLNQTSDEQMTSESILMRRMKFNVWARNGHQIHS